MTVQVIHYRFSLVTSLWGLAPLAIFSIIFIIGIGMYYTVEIAE
jgi:hypothetical protein